MIAPSAGGFALIRWPPAPPREMRVEGQTDLVRARLHPGQRVRVIDPATEASEQAAAVEGVVERALEDGADALWRYAVRVGDEERALDETWLDPTGPRSGDPLELLTALSWRGSAAFGARLELLRSCSLWYEDAFGIPAFLGARIQPLPHQIHAARRVLTDRAPRFVLADEVGLGKTIEAGLVLQALAAAEHDLRVLVVAPGAMSRQWLCELFLRFGEQVFVHVDAARLDAAEVEDLLAAPRLIVSTAALEAAPSFQEALLGARWDVVVVDEAHQVHPDLPLYGCLRRLATEARGLLALSATPAKGDVRGLLGLLGLVAPEAYDPAQPERFARALEARDRVATALDETLRELERRRAAGEAAPLAWRAQRADALVELLADDPHARDFAARVEQGEEEALDELLAYVQEYHRVDRRIVRTRRATVQQLGTALCKREREVLTYAAPPSEVALLEHMDAVPGGDVPPDEAPLHAVLRGLYRRRACTAPVPLLELLERRRKALERPRRGGASFDPLAALGADPGPAEEEYLLGRVVAEAPPLPGEQAWLAEAIRLTHTWMTEARRGCARTQAALSWLRTARRGGRKVLVFAQDREQVEAFADALKDELGPDAVGAIHHGLDEQQLGEIALRFQQPGGPCQVLVSDELGGEGRNFQIASALLHLDQPWAVGRLEQRIGRLDRIGRRADRPVRSVVLCGPMPSERALLRLHDEVLGVYERSLGGLEFLLPEVQREVTRAACTGAEALRALAGPLAERVAAERARADQAYERALDASTRRLEEAAEQAEVLASVDGARDAPSLAAWARRVGITIKPLGDEQWSVDWRWDHLTRVPDGLARGHVPSEGRVRRRGTFSRDKALADESLELFGPGHPLVDTLVRDLFAEREGRASAWIRALGPERRGHAYLHVVARTALADEGLPSGLRYRAQAHLWTQVRSAVIRLRPGATPPATLVADRALQAALEGTDSSDRKLDPDDLARAADLRAMWAAVRAGVELALTSIREGRRAEVEDAVRRLEEDLADDVAFLRGRVARADPAERAAAEAELAARERLVAAVAGERVELEALALVIGVG